MLAILLMVGEPSASLAGMWQSWQVCGVAPGPSGSSPSGVAPVR